MERKARKRWNKSCLVTLNSLVVMLKKLRQRTIPKRSLKILKMKGTLPLISKTRETQQSRNYCPKKISASCKCV